MAKKMETAAERYRRIKAEKAKTETLHDVTCDKSDDPKNPPCGMVWKCRKVGVDFWVSSGILPLHMVETMVEATKEAGGNPDSILKMLATKEIIESIQFSNQVVKRTAVEPRIVEKPTDPSDIAQDEVDICCYKRLLKWQMSGGDEAERLGNFPQ